MGFAGFLATGLFVITGSEASLKAARTRVLGTLFGGLVVMRLIKAVSHWLAVGIGYILVKQSNGWHLFGLMLGCRTC